MHVSLFVGVRSSVCQASLPSGIMTCTVSLETLTSRRGHLIRPSGDADVVASVHLPWEQVLRAAGRTCGMALESRSPRLVPLSSGAPGCSASLRRSPS